MKVETILLLQTAVEKEKELNLPAKAGYWFARLSVFAESINKNFNKTNNDLIKSLGEPVEGKPDQIQVKKENMGRYFKEIDELTAIEETLPSFCPLKYENFAEINLSNNIWKALVPFLTEPEK